MKIKGKLIFLKTPQRKDLEYIKHLWADSKTMKEVGGRILMDDKKLNEWYKRMISPGDNRNVYFLIFTKNEKPVGEVSFHRFNKREGSADLNIKIKYTYRGMGFARESLSLLLHYYFNHFGGKIIRDKVATDNKSGQKFLQRFGFNKVKTTKDYVLFSLNHDQFMEKNI